MKQHVALTLEIRDKKNVSDAQVKWEYLKFEIRKLCYSIIKNLAKSLRLERTKLEKKLNELEKITVSYLNDNQEYKKCKSKLENIYQIKVDGVRTRRRCKWYGHGEKSLKLKTPGNPKSNLSYISNKNEMINDSEINVQISFFYKLLYQGELSFSKNDLQTYLKTVSISAFSKEQDSCKSQITEKGFLKSPKSMQNDKSPRNDGFSKEFYETFWNDIKKAFFISS